MDNQEPVCEICHLQKKDVASFCFICDQFHCGFCKIVHEQRTSTRGHCIINLISGEISNRLEAIFCDVCKKEGKYSSVIIFCHVCKQCLCKTCSSLHSRLRASMKHANTEIHEDVFVQNIVREFGGAETDTLVPGSLKADHADTSIHNDSDFVQTSVEDVPPSPYLPPTNQTIDEYSRTYTVSDGTGQHWQQQEVGQFYGVRHLHQFSVQTNMDEKESSITSIVCLQDGRILVADNGNNKIKVFARSYEFLYSMVTTDYIRGLTVVSSDKVAAAEGYGLTFIQLGRVSGLRLQKRIELSSLALNVSFASSRFAVLCHPTTVLILDDKGEQLIFNKLTSVRGNLCGSILLDHRGFQFYVSEFDPTRILCYTIYGDLIWKFYTSGEPWSILQTGSHLVAFCQKQVHAIDINGKYKNRIAVHGNKSDFNLSLGAHQFLSNKVVVAAYCGDTVKVFQELEEPTLFCTIL